VKRKENRTVQYKQNALRWDAIWRDLDCVGRPDDDDNLAVIALAVMLRIRCHQCFWFAQAQTPTCLEARQALRFRRQKTPRVK